MRVSTSAASLLALSLLTACSPGKAPDDKDQKIRDLVQSLEVGKYSPKEFGICATYMDVVKCVGNPEWEALCKSADMALNNNALEMIALIGSRDLPPGAITHLANNNGVSVKNKTSNSGPGDGESTCDIELNISGYFSGSQFNKTSNRKITQFLVINNNGKNEVEINSITLED